MPCAILLRAAAQQVCTLRIHVDGLRNRKGVVGAVVFTSAAGWPEDVQKSFRNHYAPIDVATRSATVVIKDLPPGDYGIVVLHDENENRKLDRNIFGFSNNPNVGLWAPRVRECSHARGLPGDGHHDSHHIQVTGASS